MLSTGFVVFSGGTRLTTIENVNAILAISRLDKSDVLRHNSRQWNIMRPLDVMQQSSTISDTDLGHCSLTRSYSGHRGFSVRQLKCPHHLAVDKDSQFIFVADLWNDRVVLLSPTLEFVRYVSTLMYSHWQSF